MEKSTWIIRSIGWYCIWIRLLANDNFTLKNGYNAIILFNWPITLYNSHRIDQVLAIEPTTSEENKLKNCRKWVQRQIERKEKEPTQLHRSNTNRHTQSTYISDLNLIDMLNICAIFRESFLYITILVFEEFTSQCTFTSSLFFRFRSSPLFVCWVGYTIIIGELLCMYPSPSYLERVHTTAQLLTMNNSNISRTCYFDFWNIARVLFDRASNQKCRNSLAFDCRRLYFCLYMV